MRATEKKRPSNWRQRSSLITKNLLPSLISFFFFKTRIKGSVNFELASINQKLCVSWNSQHKSNLSNKTCEKTWFMFLFPNVLNRSVTQQGRFYLLISSVCCCVAAALWANRAFDFSACWFLDVWMLDNSKLWTVKLAINLGLNDVLNPRASQSKLEKLSWGMTGHAIGYLLQGTCEWRMCSKPLLAAKLWASWHCRQP